MKRFFIWLLAAMVISFSGCSKDMAAQDEDTVPVAKKPQKLKLEGDYAVSYFGQGSVDYTDKLNGLHLIFKKDGFLVARMPLEEWTGSWNYDEKTSMLSIRIVANHTVSLISSDVWEVIEKHPTELILQAKHFEMSKNMHLVPADIIADKSLEK